MIFNYQINYKAKLRKLSHRLELSNQNSTPSDIYLVGAANKLQTSFCEALWVSSSTNSYRKKAAAHSRCLKYYKIVFSDKQAVNSQRGAIRTLFPARRVTFYCLFAALVKD